MEVKLKRKKLLLIYSTFSFMVFIIWGIWGEKYLYADGANYFLSVATEGNFMIYPLGRKTCDMLMQIFAVGAYRLGCTSLKTMGILFGFGLTFWPVLFYGMAIAVCLKYKKQEYAELVFIFASVSLIFVGFFLQIESLIGVAAYILELILYLLHKDEKLLSSYVEIGLMVIMLFLSIHLNEYFSFWGWILAIAVIYRIWFAEEKWHPLYLLMAGGQIGIALLSKNDISARGSAPSLWRTCFDILMHKWYMLWIILVLLIVFLSYERIRVRFKDICISTLEILLLVATLIWFLLRTSHIARESYNLRYTNLGWGILFGALLIVMEYKKDFFKLGNLTILCCIIAIGFTLYNVKSGIEYKKYNDEYMEFSLEHAGSGFVDQEDSTFQYSAYRWFWTVGLQSISVQGLRGTEKIDCIVLGDRDRFADKDIYQCGSLSRYGIEYDFKAFEGQNE